MESVRFDWLETRLERPYASIPLLLAYRYAGILLLARIPVLRSLKGIPAPIPI